MDFNLQTLAWVIAEIGALNWGLQELFGVNLVTELLGSGTEAAGLVYILIGLAGAVALLDKTELLDLTDI